MKKYIKPIIAVLVLALIISGIAINILSSRVKYNTTYVNGNTSGNLYNAGLFCESNGTIFFANPDDKYSLYSMDITGGNLKKLSKDTATYINADDNYVYYVRNNEKENTDYSFFSYLSLIHI